ncbi:MAG: GFA family protein [Alphaproteobacteria bacterium]|nr:GFA family protein [Alphaproteobacteria bacterium]
MTEPTKHEATCHCGAVQIAIAHRPTFVHDCNCSLCSKSGAVWGYFSTTDVNVSGATQSYQRADRSNAAVKIHFCASCGSTTHWTLTENHMSRTGINDRMGVNMRLFDCRALTGVELRFPDGKSWTGAGDFGYRREPIILDEKGL